ncbi:hypothetical protein ScPMuIL_016416 [Solemya velum]
MSAALSQTVCSRVSPPTNKPGRAKLRGLRTRTKYSPAQLDALERVFTETQYPDSDTMEELADILDVTVEKISVWFQNRRSKFKRQARDNRVPWMRKQIFRQEATTVSVNQRGCHVLSPSQNVAEQPSTPTSTNVTHGYRIHQENPRSTFHHLPDYTSHSIPFLDLKAQTSTYHTPDKIHSTTASTRSSYCSNTKTPPLSSVYPQQLSYETSLQLSHLLNDLPISPLFPMSPLPGRQSVFSFPSSPSSPMFYPQTNFQYYSSPVAHPTSNV